MVTVTQLLLGGVGIQTQDCGPPEPSLKNTAATAEGLCTPGTLLVFILQRPWKVCAIIPALHLSKLRLDNSPKDRGWQSQDLSPSLTDTFPWTQLQIKTQVGWFLGSNPRAKYEEDCRQWDFSARSPLGLLTSGYVHSGPGRALPFLTFTPDLPETWPRFFSH